MLVDCQSHARVLAPFTSARSFSVVARSHDEGPFVQTRTSCICGSASIDSRVSMAMAAPIGAKMHKSALARNALRELATMQRPVRGGHGCWMPRRDADDGG